MAKKIVSLEAKTVTFDLTKEGKGSIVFSLDQVNEQVATQLALHGASQKIGDGYASAKDAEDPAAFIEEAINDAIADLYAGNWRAARAGGGGTTITLLARALARVTGQTDREAQDFIDNANGQDDDGNAVGMTKEQKAEWSAKKKVARALAEIRAEDLAEASKRAAKKAAEAAKADDAEEGEEEEITLS